MTSAPPARRITPAGYPRTRRRPARRPLYYLLGTAGHPNYGDELIASIWLRHLARIAPEADVWLDCPVPGSAAVLLDGLHPRARFTDTAWRLCAEAPPGGPWGKAAWVQSALENPGLAYRWVNGIELMASADVVHVIGGGYVNGIWPHHIGLLGAAAAATRRSGGRAVLTGQGFTPVDEAEASLLRALVDRFDVVDVRDAASAEALRMPQAQGVDDAFLGAGAFPHVEHTADLPRYMLCLQSDMTEHDGGDLAAFTLATLRAWNAEPADVGIVEGIPGQDRAVFGLIEHALPGARFFPFSEVWRSGMPVAPHQTWLSTRFHVHLVAAAAGASGVAVSLKPDYYTTKHGSLVELGSHWQLVEDLTDVPKPPDGGGFDPEALAGHTRRKAAVAARIYPG
ncbi:polysaccharide pyruvyl transferase family protein [Pseudonocardia sp. T1-2H]|uniref:polysaccharide pyruvyl transferase family protein n=1 Tax=Pseudonocardia sp. T1-2H TaxID=3128899 RepID=UPI003100C198